MPEFVTFTDIINRRNFEECYALLDKSLEVSRILTDIRRKAGIIFPADNR